MLDVILTEGTKFKAYNLESIQIIDTQEMRGIEFAKVQEHAICFHHEAVHTEDTCGGRVERNFWDKGAVGWLPANMDLISRPEKPYSETAIRFSNGLIAKACAAEIDHSKIDFRFTNVGTPLTYQMSCCLLHLATSGVSQDWPMLVESATLTLLLALFHELSPWASKILRGRPTGFDTVRKRRVVDYIEANLHRQITVEELAAVACMSQFHFIRSFKRAFGLPPARYVAQRRVEEAQRLMLGSRRSLAEVALDCGFCNQSHMTRIFKSLAGTTPGVFRVGAWGA